MHDVVVPFLVRRKICSLLLEGAIMKQSGRIIIVALTLPVFFLVLGAVTDKRRVVKAEEFVLCDSMGKKRASFEMTHRGPALLFFDNKDKPRIAIIQADGDKSTISFLDANGKLRLTIVAAKGIYALTGMDEDEKPIWTVPESSQLLSGAMSKDESDPEQYDKTTSEFLYENIHFKKSVFGGVDVIGEIANNSGKDYSFAMFKISLYDTNNRLLGIGNIVIPNLGNGQKKSFETMIEVEMSAIDKYKIDFEM